MLLMNRLNKCTRIMCQKVVHLLLFSFLSVTILISAAYAQTETGQIIGSVTDPTGAVISNAKVKIVNKGTGSERVVSTDNQGNFISTNLLPALYEITIEVSGFAEHKRQVQVTVGSRTSATVQLAVQATQQIVDVVADSGVQINVETQSLSQVIDARKIVELPTVTRNPYDFVATSGNVSTTDPTGRGAMGVAMNGLRASSTNVLLDGAANNNEFSATVGQSIPLDSVQEYSIITNNFTAEYGRATGGIVNVATKSGTNSLHGTAYHFGRYSKLNTNSFNRNANGIEKPVYTRNQFGYSTGGRIIADKLFFFQSTEWLRIRSMSNRIVVVPTDTFLNLSAPATKSFFSKYGQLKSGMNNLGTITRQDFPTDPCIPGSVCATSTTLTTPLFTRLSYNVPSDSGGGDPQNNYNLVGRIDWNVSDKTQIYGNYALDKGSTFNGTVSDSPFVGFDTGAQATNNRILLSMIRTFSPQFLLQSKVVFNRLNELNPIDQAQPTLFWGTRAIRVLGDLAALPGYLPFAPGSAIPFGGPQNFLQTYQDMSYTRSAHNFRFGGSYVYIRDNRTFGAYQNSVESLSTSTFSDGLNNFLNGQLAQFQSAIDPQGKFPCSGAIPTPDCTVTLPVRQPNFSRSNRYHEFALYGQDSWRAKSNITLNLGLRWEYFGVQHNKDASLDSNYYDADDANQFQAIRNGAVTNNKGLWEKDFNNFAPRIGFAWDLFGDGKTSLRGGYGIGYERNFGNVTFNVIQNPPNYAVVSIRPADIGGPIPISTEVAGPLAGSSGSKGLPQVSLRNVNPKIRTAYAHFWSLSLERELARNLVVGMDYSASKGQKLYSLEDPNRAGFGNVYLGDAPATYDPVEEEIVGLTRLRTTQFTNINRRSGNGFSDYHAFNFRMNLNNIANTGLRLTTNYTWSHAIDNLSSTFSESANNFNLGLLNPFDPALDKGNADFDLRHRFVASGIWDIPFARNLNGISKHILHGWQFAPIFTARTGTPYTIFDCNKGNEACPRLFQAGDLTRTGSNSSESVKGTFTYLQIARSSIDTSWVNPLTLTSDVGPFPKNMNGRNLFVGPNYWNIDFGIYKNFQITEGLRLQYRAEFYNAFNHANTSILGSAAEIPVSGDVIISSQKDGNRNIQMALKLIF